MVSSVKRILGNKGGETIIEAVVSLLVFALLMLAVGTMISASLRVTGNSNQRYRQLQAAVKLVVEEDSTIYTIGDNVTFTITTAPTVDKTFTQQIKGTAADNIVAFYPEVVTPP